MDWTSNYVENMIGTLWEECLIFVHKSMNFLAFVQVETDSII